MCGVWVFFCGWSGVFPYDRRVSTASLAHHRQWGAAPLRLAWVLGGVPTRVTPHQKASTWDPPLTPPWGPMGRFSQ